VNNFDAMFVRLNKEQPSRELQTAVAELVAESLAQAKGSFGYWEKEHFAHAITALASNIGKAQAPTSIWLRLALVSAEKALIRKEQRNEAYGRKDESIDEVTYEELVEEVQQLLRKI
jgi:hypothetical protein